MTNSETGLELGATIAVEDEAAFHALSAASATVAAHADRLRQA